MRATRSMNNQETEQTGDSTEENTQRPSYDFDAHFISEYLKPFKTDPTDIALTAPDWSRTEQKDLRLQARWSFYRVIGESYVDGIMDGEAVAYQYREKIPETVFELQ